MKKRRENKKQFNVLLDKVLVENFEKILEEKNQTKIEWTTEKIEEEIEKHGK